MKKPNVIKIILNIIFSIIITIPSIVYATQSDLNSNDVKKILSKAYKYANKNQNEKAIVYFDKAIELEPNNGVIYALKTFVIPQQEQEEFVLKALEKFPNNTVLNLTAGQIYIVQNKPDKTIEYAQKAIELSPSDFLPYKVLAIAYLSKQDYKSAIHVYKQAQKIFPKKDELYFWCAKICGDIEDYQCSLENAEKLVELNPNDTHMYSYRATYRMITKDYDGALDDLDKATKLLGKETANILADKAEIYYRKGDYESSLQFLFKALNKDKYNQTANGLLAMFAYMSGNYEQTIKSSDICLKYNNGIVYPVRFWKTQALYKMGKVEEALKEVDILIQESPKNIQYIELKNNMVNKSL